VHVEDGRLHLQGVAVAEPQRGADAGPELEVGVLVTESRELAVGEVRDPDPLGRHPCGHHVGHQPLHLGDVGPLGDREVEGDPLQTHAADLGPQADGLAQVAGGEPVPAHRGHPLEDHPGALGPAGQRLEVLKSADGVHHVLVEDRPPLGRPPRGQHQHGALERLRHLGDLGVGADRHGVEAEPGGQLAEPGDAEAVAVALGHRDDARMAVPDAAQVRVPALAVDVQGEGHRHRPPERRAM
jgi:hypothetical protein